MTPEIRETLEDAREVLISVQELLDDYSDVVDGDEESGPRPNRAMSLLRPVEESLAQIEKALEEAK